MTTPGVAVAAVVQAQRTAGMRALQEYTRLKRGTGSDTSWLLVLDAMIFQVEAELRWLDHCEATVLRQRPDTAGKPAPAAVQRQESKA